MPLYRKVFQCLFAVTLLCAGQSLWAESPSPKPNILVIFTDDQTYRAIGYNNADIKTPHLDTLAKEGLIFTHAYVASPICAASRASMMSGQFPQQHGAIALDASRFKKQFVEERTLPTLAGILGTNGYDTAFSGKSHLDDPKAYGFDVGQEHRDYDDQDAFNFAEEFIQSRNQKETPFFLWLAPRQPHVPLLPEQQWLDLYDADTLPIDENFRESPLKISFNNQGLPGENFHRGSTYTNNYKNVPVGPPRSPAQVRDFIKAYYATISHLDDQVGHLIQELKDSGQYENTLIIYLSDNGFHLGNHGLGNKITMHEESVRVPFFVHGKGIQAIAQRSDELVSSIDVFPTLLEFAGIAPPAHIAGQSLLPLFSDPKHLLRPYVASECVGVDGLRGTGHRMVRTKRWKYMLSGTNEEALFDQANDPYELTNLVNETEHSKTLAQMREYMLQWMAQVGDTHARPPID